MGSITAIAQDFFSACETGKGWEVCKAYCIPNATFTAQAEPLAAVKTLAEYADWMKGLMTIMPDGSYEVTSENGEVAVYELTITVKPAPVPSPPADDAEGKSL